MQNVADAHETGPEVPAGSEDGGTHAPEVSSAQLLPTAMQNEPEVQEICPPVVTSTFTGASQLKLNDPEAEAT